MPVVHNTALQTDRADEVVESAEYFINEPISIQNCL